MKKASGGCALHPCCCCGQNLSWQQQPAEAQRRIAIRHVDEPRLARRPELPLDEHALAHAECYVLRIAAQADQALRAGQKRCW